jgi:hypothetical protein
MKLTGKITEFDAAKRTGTVEDSDGKNHIIQPGSFRRTTILRQGDRVQFQSFNLSAGPVAQDIEPELASVFANFQTDLPR